MSRKTKKEKPRYNVLQNTGFMIRTAWQTEKSVLLHVVLQAMLFVGLQLTELYIAPSVVAAVEARVPLARLLGTLGVFIGLLLVLRTAARYTEEITLFPRITVRMAILSMMNTKACSTSFVNRYDKTFQQLEAKSHDSTNSNHAATEAVWATLTRLLQFVLGIAAYATVLVTVEAWLLMVIVVTALIGFAVNRYINEYSYRHREELADIERRLWYIQTAESDHRIAKDIRIFGLGNWLEELYLRSLNAFRAFQLRMQKVYLIANLTSIALTLLRNGVAYAYLIAAVLQGELSAAEFLLYFNAVSSAAWLIGDVLNTITALHRQSADISTVREYLYYPEPFRFEDGEALRYDPEKDYEIRLENVSFRYPNAQTDVLRQFNLTLHAGEKLAVVGLNGAGKTMLVKLIAGLFDPTEGCVTLNGTDIRVYNRRDYYKLFSAVFQQFSVLAASVAENVAQSNVDVDRERVCACLEQAGLTAKLATLSEGIDTKLDREVFDDATELSGGELQRLMLARALYKQAPILLLDEPTAALDPLAESAIYEAYDDMAHGKSAVFISHRLASTRFCDRIILIENGVIAEEGTHEQLMARGGRYAALFAVQSRYYIEGGVDDGE